MRHCVAMGVCAALGAAFAGAPAAPAQADAGLTYKGKSLTEWVQSLDSPELDVRVAAADAVGHFGPAAAVAVPGLIEMLKTDVALERDSFGFPARQFVPGPFGTMPPKSSFGISFNDPADRVKKSLLRIGPAAVGPLIREAAREGSRIAPLATVILQDFGPAAAPELVKTLDSPIQRIRVGAAHLLAPLGPEAVKAVPILAYELSRQLEQDYQLNYDTIRALEAIGPAAKPALPALIRAFRKGQRRDGNDERVWAIGAIENIGPGAVKAVPALVADLAKPEIRDAAANALAAIGLAAQAAIPELRSQLAKAEAGAVGQLDLATALWKIEGKSEDVIPVYVEILKREDSYVGDDVLGRFLSLGERAKPAAAALRAALAAKAATNREVDGTQVRLAMALWSVDPKPDVMLPILTKVLDQREWRRYELAIEGLGRMGPAARPALPQLAKALHQEKGDGGNWFYSIRLAAADAIWSIGRDAEAVLPTLRDAITDYPEDGSKYSHKAFLLLGKIGPAAAPAAPAVVEFMRKNWRLDWRDAAKPFEALGQMGPAARAVVPALREGLHDPQPLVRVSAADALWRVDNGHADALASLVTSLGDGSALVRLRAAKALGRMGQGATAANPALASRLTDEYAEVRRAAATALGSIGSGAKSTVPAVVAALSDVDEGVRTAAAEALRHINPTAARRAGVDQP